jgi:hypothetical protein
MSMRNKLVGGWLALGGAGVGAWVTAGLANNLLLFRSLHEVTTPTPAQYLAAAVVGLVGLGGVAVTGCALWASWHLFRSAVTSHSLPRALGGKS